MRIWTSQTAGTWCPWHGTEPEWPPVLARMRLLSERDNVSYRVISHAKAETASELADSIHPIRGEVVKVVIVRADKSYVMAVLPFYRQLDLIRFAQALGVPHASLADEREIQRLFPDCQVGAMPPLGQLYGLRVYVDASLVHEPEIVFPVGSHRLAVAMRYEDFGRLVHPVVGDFSMTRLKNASGF